jgi:hypothetical protein
MLRCIDVAAGPRANQLILQNDVKSYSVGIKNLRFFQTNLYKQMIDFQQSLLKSELQNNIKIVTT